MLCVILDLVSYHHFPASVFIHQGKCLANSLALRWEKGDNRSLGERHHFLGVFTMKRKDITGQKFGRLTVVRYEGAAKNGNATWLCQCDCGQRTIVDGYRLRKGATTSCGCYRREVMREKSEDRSQNWPKESICRHGRRQFECDVNRALDQSKRRHWRQL